MTFPKTSENFIKLEKPPYFRGLRWKITLSFVFLFFCLWLVLGFGGATLEYHFLRQSFAESAVSENNLLSNWSGLGIENIFSIEVENSLAVDYKNLQKDSAEMIPWLNSQNKNNDAIKLWLERYDEKLKLRRKSGYPTTYNFRASELTNPNSLADKQNTNLSPFQFIVFDVNGQIIATSKAANDAEFTAEKQFAADIINKSSTGKKEIDEQNKLCLKLAFPLLDEQNNLLGVLFLSDALPISWSSVPLNSLYDFNEQLFPNLIFFGILGFVFGSPFAWYLSKRLQKIAFAAQSWRIGDFSARTNDKSRDEIGILSRDLNEMADDLSENFELRQTIATVEERNRIARDLHDSVKQQVFGLAMQISTANALVEKNPDSAKNYLQESENLIKEIQAELVDMIREFSLPANENETLNKRLENLIGDWTRQNVVRTQTNIASNLKTSSAIAQTFYRITQETLANVARHSEATEVKISLENTDGKLAMKIADNGCGFDDGKIEKGFGLQSIRSRAENLPKGWIKIESKPNAGTAIEFGCEAEN